MEEEQSTKSGQSINEANQGTHSVAMGTSVANAGSGISSTSLFEKFDNDYQKVERHHFFGVIDATLKRPAQIARAMMDGRESIVAVHLMTVLVICLAGIGTMMGGFSGGDQLWAVPIKVVFGTAVSALICLPSLYILICLSGGEQSFRQVGRLLLLALTLSGMLFLGFLPVAWIFSEATESVVFMGILYMLIWGIGLFFGMRLLKTTFRFLNRKSMGAIGFWVVIFVLVLLQMSTTLRPLMGPFEPLQFAEKKFFIAHWIASAQQ